MGALLNRARMTTATTGTGTITLGSASAGFASFAEAGATNATAYSYCIEDGNDFEIGVGTYTSSGTTFSRDTVTLSKISGTAGTTKLTLSGSATIFITARAQEIATLDAAQTYTATQTITPAANTAALVSSGGSLTGANAQSLIDLAQTWNTSGTPSAIRLNITNTASNAASTLVDLLVGGSRVLAVRRDGRILGDGANPYLELSQGNGTTLAWASTSLFCGTNMTLSTGGQYQFSNSGNVFFSVEGGGNIFAQRNATNAQTFRVYNTFTDASNYERGVISWSVTANRFIIGTENAGTGAARSVQIGTGNGSVAFLTSTAGRVDYFTGDVTFNSNAGTEYWRIRSQTTGALVAGSDNTYDIGASGANRPRNLYMGSWIRFAVTTVGSLPAAGTAGQGARMLVTDANATTFQSVVAGGGANIVPVYSDGTNWRIG